MSTSLLLLLSAIFIVAVVVGSLMRKRWPAGGDGNVMKELRLRVLRDVPEGVGTAGKDEPLIVVMDIGFPNATASVFAALTGDASLYISSGGASSAASVMRMSGRRPLPSSGNRPGISIR